MDGFMEMDISFLGKTITTTVYMIQPVISENNDVLSLAFLEILQSPEFLPL